MDRASLKTSERMVVGIGDSDLRLGLAASFLLLLREPGAPGAAGFATMHGVGGWSESENLELGSGHPWGWKLKLEHSRFSRGAGFGLSFFDSECLVEPVDLAASGSERSDTGAGGNGAPAAGNLLELLLGWRLVVRELLLGLDSDRDMDGSLHELDFLYIAGESFGRSSHELPSSPSSILFTLARVCYLQNSMKKK